MKDGTSIEIAQAFNEDYSYGELFDYGIEDEFAFLQMEDTWIVSSATRTEQTIEEAPAIVTVITANDIRYRGYTSIAQILRQVPGFYVIDNHILPNAAVRGISGGMRAESGVIKVLIDGRSVASRLTGGNWLGPELIPMTSVQRVEIIRGPASAVYGADAFLGVINVVTKEADSVGGLDMAFDIGLLGANPSGKIDLTGALNKDNLDAIAAFSFYRSDMSGLALPETSPAPVIPEYRKAGDLAQGAVRISTSSLLRMNYRLSESSRISISSYLSGLDVGAEFADWSQLVREVNPDGSIDENRLSMVQGHSAINWTFEPTESLNLSLDLMYFRGGPTSRERLEIGSDLYFVRREYTYQGTEILSVGSWHLNDRISLLGSVDLVWDRETMPSILHVLKAQVGDWEAGSVRESTSSRMRDPIDFLNSGLGLQVLWREFEGKLGLTFSVRHDLNNIYGNQTSARAATVFNPHSSVNVKLLYGNAFKAPSPYLLYGIPIRSGDITGNPNLEPQRVHTLESQLSLSPGKGVFFQTDFAYSYLRNKAEFVLQGVNRVASNVAEVEVFNWETEVAWRGIEWLQPYVNISLMRGRRNLGMEGYQAQLLGADISGYPNRLGAFGACFFVTRLSLNFSFEANLVGKRKAADNNVLEAGEQYGLPAYVLLGGYISLMNPLGGDNSSRLSINLSNVFNARGPDPGFSGVDYPLAPRAVFLQWRQSM